jgi:hypothetical protein
MDTVQWLDYFERNERRPSPDTPAVLPPLPPALQRPLVQALQCFQLGEAGGGSLTERARRSKDPALDDALRIAIGFYVREEGRHARELARLLRAMGEPTIEKNKSDWLFQRSRRLLGLRGKMAVIAVAEIVGSTFYDTLATRIPCPHVAEVARVIANDEDRHLAFQRDYFTRVLAVTPFVIRPVLALLLWVWFLSVLMGAIASVAFGQRKLFVALGMSPFTFAAHCLRRLWRLVNEREGVGLALGHERKI